MDWPLRRRRVRPAVDFREVGNRDRRDLVRDFLVLRKDVRVGDPVAAALVEIALEDVDEHLVERMGVARFVDQVVPQRAGPAGGLGRVGAVPVGAREGERAAERVNRRPVVLAVPVGERVAGVVAVVEADVVLALILRVGAVDDRIGRARLETRCRQREHAQEREAVGAEAVRRNDVAGERQSGRGIADDLR